MDLCVVCGHEKAGHFTADHTPRSCAVFGVEKACGCPRFEPPMDHFEPCHLCHHAWEYHFVGRKAIPCQSDRCGCTNALGLCGEPDRVPMKAIE